MYSIKVESSEDRRQRVTLEQKGNMSSNKSGSKAGSNKDTSIAKSAYDKLMKDGK